jgi:hypothetical protein
MTALMIFAKPQVAPRIQWIQSAAAGVGFWNMGNKGAVGMRIGISCLESDDTVDIAFVSAHLAPHEIQCEVRNQDWKNIVRNMIFTNHDSHFSFSEEMALTAPRHSPADDSALFSPGSHLFFAGDLNYRTSDHPPDPDSHESYPQPTTAEASAEHFSGLLKKDQLNREREANRTLHSLHELPINYPPTYKYSPSKHKKTHKRSASDVEMNFEWAKHRYPSWCDRILFLPPPSSYKLEGQKYTALPVQSTSDHRPVALSLRLDDRPLPRDSNAVTQPPFPVNPDWRTRQDAARRWEIVVGILSYLALTNKGRAMIVAVLGTAFTTWYLSVWLRR